ncbi:MAG: bifunctional phosphoribosylaminoimidazolecarboxamide formyltransferase/IMP cyclohydrolase [Chloroflexi bacterium]|nr:bifunctional phosphoribosylaminoimidazolecarboxamide formyltransferase/IMP cyclohydrolase [Chloroflexota bacterium]
MRALISVSDKAGVVDFARGLELLGAEIYSTGGTESLLRQEGVAVRGVQELTGFPEMLGGRVKTLHPKVFGGILALRDDAGHQSELSEHGLAPIDLVAVNLYPFVETVRQSGVALADALEHIDIGGPSLLRAAAKNFASVAVVCDPRDYPAVLSELEQPGGLDQETRRRLAARAFQHCAVYDTNIADYLRPADDLFPDEYTLALCKLAALRYGENPHQLAAIYTEATWRPRPGGIAQAVQLHGKQLSFNNTYDLDAAWNIVSDFSAPCVTIVKHGNPCGLACADDLTEAFQRALATDPQSAFGGAVALNRVVDVATAEAIKSVFFEDLVAPDFTPEALEVLRTKRDLRVLSTGAGSVQKGGGVRELGLDYKRIGGGFLVQTPDNLGESMLTRDVVTTRHPSLSELTGLLFAWRAVKHASSNAVVLAKGLSLVGVGAGQPSRVDSVEIAARKAGDRAVGSVMASDAFFPFPDGIERAAEAGVTAVIQPGGSIRDQEAIKAANRHHMARIFTHQRHFKHR